MRRAAGLALAAALLVAGWLAWGFYGAFADIGRWSGIPALAPLRPWLVELKMPLLAAAGFLTLSAVSWVCQKLKLGH